MINILTGPVHSGKTSLLKNTIPVLRENKFRIDGYLSEAVWKSEEFLGYKLVDLGNHRDHPFILKQGQQEWQKIGSFFFLPETLALAKKIIRRSEKSDLCIVDEVGPLELSGKGVWPVLEDMLTLLHPHFLLVIRDSIVEKVLDKFQRDDFVVYDIEQNKKPLRMAKSLMKDLEKRKKSEQK